eukprot:PhF_6_TR26385/c0_g1_i3/m.38069
MQAYRPKHLSNASLSPSRPQSSHVTPHKRQRQKGMSPRRTSSKVTSPHIIEHASFISLTETMNNSSIATADEVLSPDTSVFGGIPSHLYSDDSFFEVVRTNLTKGIVKDNYNSVLKTSSVMSPEDMNATLKLRLDVLDKSMHRITSFRAKTDRKMMEDESVKAKRLLKESEVISARLTERTKSVAMKYEYVTSRNPVLTTPESIPRVLSVTSKFNESEVEHEDIGGSFGKSVVSEAYASAKHLKYGGYRPEPPSLGIPASFRGRTYIGARINEIKAQVIRSEGEGVRKTDSTPPCLSNNNRKTGITRRQHALGIYLVHETTHREEISHTMVMPHRIRNTAADMDTVTQKHEAILQRLAERKLELASRRDPSVLELRDRARMWSVLVHMAKAMTVWKACRYESSLWSMSFSTSRGRVRTLTNKTIEIFRDKIKRAAGKVREHRVRRAKAIFRAVLMITSRFLHFRRLHSSIRLIQRHLATSWQGSFIAVALRRYTLKVRKLQRIMRGAQRRSRLRMAWALLLWFDAEGNALLNANARLMAQPKSHMSATSTVVQTVLAYSNCPSDIKIRYLKEHFARSGKQYYEAMKIYSTNYNALVRAGNRKDARDLPRPYYRIIISHATLVGLVNNARSDVYDDLEQISMVKYSNRLHQHTDAVTQGLRLALDKRCVLAAPQEKRLLEICPEIYSLLTKRHKIALMM